MIFYAFLNFLLMSTTESSSEAFSKMSEVIMHQNMRLCQVSKSMMLMI